MSDLWKQLQEATANGEAIKVNLTAGARVKIPKKRGRKRVRGAVPFSHYEGFDATKGGRPRCAAKGCQTRLRRGQLLACSTPHEEKVAGEARRLLAVLEAPCAS